MESDFPFGFGFACRFLIIFFLKGNVLLKILLSKIVGRTPPEE